MTEPIRTREDIDAETAAGLSTIAHRLVAHANALLPEDRFIHDDVRLAVGCADAAARCYEAAHLYSPPSAEAQVALWYAREIDALHTTIATGNDAARAAAESRLRIVRAVIAERPGEERAR